MLKNKIEDSETICNRKSIWVLGVNFCLSVKHWHQFYTSRKFPYLAKEENNSNYLLQIIICSGQRLNIFVRLQGWDRDYSFFRKCEICCILVLHIFILRTLIKVIIFLINATQYEKEKITGNPEDNLPWIWEIHCPPTCEVIQHSQFPTTYQWSYQPIQDTCAVETKRKNIFFEKSNTHGSSFALPKC